MPVELFFSNRLEELADKFAATVDLENRGKGDIFQGPLTIVPNQNLKKWLQLTLAGRLPVLMNVDFQYLESGLWDLLAGIDPRAERPEILDSRFFRMLLLYALKNPAQDDADLAPLTGYLLGTDGKRGRDYGAKLWQLTGKMAQLFEDYEFHRSEMIEAWLEQRGSPTNMELCQRNLYLLSRELRDRYVQASGRPVLSMGEYARTVLGSVQPGTGTARRFVHIFGLSQVSRFHLWLIYGLKDYYPIFIYTLNPCREFWEDTRTPREKRWIARKNALKFRISREETVSGELAAEESHELLSLWGKPGRENVRLLCQLTDYHFNACFRMETGPRGLLQEVQRRILTLSTETGAQGRIEQDRSLQIFGCPGIYREVETVYNSILHNLEHDRGLQLTDIAVLVPDISKYKPVIDSVFNRRPARISYCLVDSRADIESLYGQAVLGILGLAAGRFTRREVFDFILNPCFMKRWDIDQEEVGLWAAWTDALNIFHSFDQEAKCKGGYWKSDLYTWHQGLQRLRLSRVMAPPHEGGGNGFRHFKGLVPFHDRDSGDVEPLEKFSLIIEKIHAAIMDMAELRAPGEEWRRRLVNACGELLEIPPDLRGEAAIQESLMEALQDLRVYDALLMKEPEGGGEADLLDLDLIREFVKSSLGAISGSYGDYLTEGVTVSALQPMRPIPFRIIYVLGMEEGGFPGQADRSSLDLRLLKRQIGDLSVPERNCYLFLEMLLSVREKLYLSYLARDLQKDRVIEPCSLVNQLIRYVEREILPPGKTFNLVHIPLSGTSERYLAQDAVNKRSDLLVNYSLADRVALILERGMLKEVQEELPEEIMGDLKPLFPDFHMERERDRHEKAPAEKITLKQLKKFLEDPVSHWIKRHLGVYDQEEAIEEITLREDEPFFSRFPADYNLKVVPLRIWLDAFSASGDLETVEQTPEGIYDQVYKAMELKGATPEGAFARLDRERLRHDVAARAGILRPVVAEMGSGKEIYRAVIIGGGGGEEISPGNRLKVQRFDPVRLRVKTHEGPGEGVEQEVELHGQLPWIWKDATGHWNVLVLTGSGKAPTGKEPDKYILEPLMFWIFCLMEDQARHWMGGQGVSFHIIYGERARTWTYRLNQDVASEFMHRLVSDYLNRNSVEWLPFKEVTHCFKRLPGRKGGRIYEREGTGFHALLCDRYQEEESVLVRLARPVIPQDAFEKARDRFRVFFDFER